MRVYVCAHWTQRGCVVVPSHSSLARPSAALVFFFSSSFLVSHAALRVRVRVAKLSENDAARAYAHTSTAISDFGR